MIPLLFLAVVPAEVNTALRNDSSDFWASQRQFEEPLGLKCKLCGSTAVIRASCPLFGAFYCFNCTHLNEAEVERALPKS